MPKRKKTYDTYTDFKNGGVSYERAIDLLDYFAISQDQGTTRVTSIYQLMQLAETEERDTNILEKRLDRATVVFKYLRIPFNRTMEYEGPINYGIVTLEIPITEAMGIVDIGYGRRTEDSDNVIEQRLLAARQQQLPFAARLMINEKRMHQEKSKSNPQYPTRPEKRILGAIAQSIISIICEPEEETIREGMHNGKPGTYQLQPFLEQYYPGTTMLERINNFIDYAQFCEKQPQDFGYATAKERKKTMVLLRAQKELHRMPQAERQLPTPEEHMERNQPVIIIPHSGQPLAREQPTIDDIFESVTQALLQQPQLLTVRGRKQLEEIGEKAMIALIKLSGKTVQETARQLQWTNYQTAEEYQHVNGIANHLSKPLDKHNCNQLAGELVEHYTQQP